MADIIRYYTQRRFLLDGKPYIGWDEICSGHEQLMNALGCHDDQRDAMLGGPHKENRTSYMAAIDEAIHLRHIGYLQQGYEVEIRMVKIIQTEVVIEPASIVKQVKPRKEVE